MVNQNENENIRKLISVLLIPSIGELNLADLEERINN
jgi:hypothetical protein